MFRNILKSKKLLLLIVPIFVFAGFACSSDSTDYELWSADIIQDGIIDILDIISIVNIVMDN